MKKQHIGIVLFLSFLLLSEVFMVSEIFAYNSENETIIPNDNSLKMDTSHWVTYPVGRYLIKLPATVKISKWTSAFYAGLGTPRFVIQWEKGLSYSSALAKLKEKAEEVKKKMDIPMNPNDDWRAYPTFINIQEHFSPQKRGSLLTIHYDSPKMVEVSYDIVTVNKTHSMDPELPERVFSLKKPLIDYTNEFYSEDGEYTLLSPMRGEVEPNKNTAKAFEKFMAYVTDNIMPHDASLPLANSRGIYFEGGFLPDPPQAENIMYPKSESALITLTFADYPDIVFDLGFEHSERTALVGWWPSLPWGPGVEKKNAIITGRVAEEKLASSYSYSGAKSYKFSLVAKPEDTFEKPKIVMLLRTLDDSELETSSFKSDKEAVAFWNAIKENIRWRPDNWKVKAPDTPYFIVYDKIVPAVMPE